MNHKQGGSFITGLLVVLAIVFGGALYLSTAGWGYMGYGGYHHGPSFLYFGGPSYVHQSRSIREGSLGSPGHRGGGLRGGK